MSEEPEQQDPRRLVRSKAEVRLDETTRAAASIIEKERFQQDAKTARLRAARLARDAADAASADKA